MKVVTLTKKRLRGFLSPLEKKYLEFLQYENREGNEYDNRKAWSEKEKMPNRALDHRIRWKVRYALDDLRLVFEKFGFIGLQSLFEDEEVLNNLSYLNETVMFIEVCTDMLRHPVR